MEGDDLLGLAARCQPAALPELSASVIGKPLDPGQILVRLPAVGIRAPAEQLRPIAARVLGPGFPPAEALGENRSGFSRPGRVVVGDPCRRSESDPAEFAYYFHFAHHTITISDPGSQASGPFYQNSFWAPWLVRRGDVVPEPEVVC